MDFQNFAGQIKSLVNFDTFIKPPPKYKEVWRFTVFQGEMVKKTVVQTKFSQLNDKRFYLSDGIVSLLYGHMFRRREKGVIEHGEKSIEKYPKTLPLLSNLNGSTKSI